MTKRVLFLLSDTGSGHRAAAQAIDEALQHLYPHGYHSFMDDVWQKHTPYPCNQIPPTYPWFSSQGLGWWKLMWRLTVPSVIHLNIIRLFSQLVKRSVTAYFRHVQPDIVVSVHPFMNHIGWRILRSLGLNVPFLTVVTDLVTLHPTWICPDVTHCFVPTAEARQKAIQLGLASAKVTVAGQPVSLKFSQMTRDKIALRHELGLDPHRRTILVMGGGEGFGQIYAIARAVATTNPAAQLILVSGRNEALRQQLSQVTWEIPTQVHGFVPHIPKLMGSADVLITKAGPNTIGEALIAHLPMILSGYVPDQETGNIRYVEQHGVGKFIPQPAQIAQQVAHWFNHEPQVLQCMARHAAQLANPQASLNIAQQINHFSSQLVSSQLVSSQLVSSQLVSQSASQSVS